MATPKPQRGGLERNSSLNWRALPGTMTKAWKAARPSPPQPASSPPPLRTSAAYPSIQTSGQHPRTQESSSITSRGSHSQHPQRPSTPRFCAPRQSEIHASGRAPFRFRPIEGASSTSIRAGSGSTAAAARALGRRPSVPRAAPPATGPRWPSLRPRAFLSYKDGGGDGWRRRRAPGTWPWGGAASSSEPAAPCPGGRARDQQPPAAPRRRVQKEFESEHQVRVGGLLRRAGSASSPLGRPPAARTPSLLAVWKCLLSWFSQIQHKRRLLPVRGAATMCPAPSAPCSVLKGLRHHLPGRAQATPACGSLSCSRLPAGLAMAIWGGGAFAPLLVHSELPVQGAV